MLFEQARQLLRAWWQENPAAAIRLLGVGTSQFAPVEQADLFAAAPDREKRPGKTLDSLVDNVRERFGAAALVRGRLLKESDK